MQNKDEQLNSLKDIFEIYEWLIKNENDIDKLISKEKNKEMLFLRKNFPIQVFVFDDMVSYIGKLLEFKRYMKNGEYMYANFAIQSFIITYAINEERIYYNLIDTIKEELWDILKNGLAVKEKRGS